MKGVNLEDINSDLENNKKDDEKLSFSTDPKKKAIDKILSNETPLDYYINKNKLSEKEKLMKLGSRKAKAFQVYSVNQLEHLNDLKDPFKFMKNKIKIENMI